MSRIRLTWTNASTTIVEQRVYRSISPLDFDDMPDPLAVLPRRNREYLDSTVEDGLAYYYAVSSVLPDYSELISEEIKVEATPGESDPYWDQVVALLHFDGPDGSAVFNDETGKAWSPSGNARISISQYVFGGGSGFFDASSNTRLASPASQDFFIGSGDFTIESWVYIAGNSARSSAGVRNAAIFAIAATGGASLEFFIIGDSTTTGTGLALWNGSSLVSVNGSISHGEWHYLAVSREGSLVTFWLDGVQLGEVQVSPMSLGSASHSAFVGGSIVSGYNYLLNGYMDELRITKGVARYTENFTPPTKAFPNN